MPSNTTPYFASIEFEGLTLSGPANASDFGDTVLRQADGKFLVVGQVLNGQQVQTGVPGADGLVSRFNADGSLDTSFGTGGQVTLPASPDLTARAALLQSDGKLLIVGGTIKSGAFYQFAVYRLNADGTLDTGFDGDGIANTIIGTRTDVARAVALQADGKIVVAGGTSSGLFDTSGSRDFALVRYNADGSLDTTFSGDGKASTPVGPSFDEATAVAVLADGKILVAGRSAQEPGQSDSDIVLARYLADGSLDTTFGTGGFVTAALTSGNDLVGSMAVQGDGKIVVAGSVDAGRGDGSTVLVLLRYNADGTLDASFDGDGQQRTELGTVLDINYEVRLQPDGKILVCGLSFYDEGRNHGFLLRYNAGGGLDTSFGNNGIVYSPFDNPVDDSFQSIALQPDGKIVVTGFAGGGPQSSYDTLVLRYNADGTLDTSFGTPPANSYVRYTLGSAPVLLAPDASVHDAELAALNGGLGDYGGASLSVARHGAANAADVLGVSGALTFGSGTTLLLHGTPVATLSAGSGSVTATFVSGTTQARADEFLQSLTYLHADAPDLHVNTGVQIDLSFSDGNAGVQGTGGALVALASSFITVEPLPVIHVDGELVNESDGVVHITVTLDHASTGTVTVDWKTADWLATAPADYVAGSGTLSFAPGETSQTIVIGLANDAQAEGLEGAFVLFDNAVGAQLRDVLGVFGIAANDAPVVALPSLAAPEAVAFEGDGLEFIVTLSAPSAQTITVDYHTGTGTTSDQDFVQASGTLVFAPGETTRTVNVQTLQDGFAESTESVNLILSGATNASIGLAQIAGYILDDDSAQAAGVTLNGTDGNDMLIGSPLPDTLLGFSGNDFLSGEGDGNNDSMAGGDGNDLYMVDSAGDIVTEAVGQGDDTIFSDLAAYTLPANVENLWLLPFEGNGLGHQLSGTGNELANQLTGNFANNTLSGAAGDDTLLGAGGQDALVGGAGNDLLDGGAITDRINYTDLNVVSYLSSTAAVNVNLSGITGTGSTGSGTASDGLGGTDTLVNIDFVTGSDFGDTLTGSSALIFEQFEGRAGNDTIDGGAIEPISQSNSNRASYQAATAAVTVNLGTGIASDGQGGTDTLININHVRGSTFSDTLTGSNTTVLTEQFEGRGGNDTIDGLGGTDMVRYDAASTAVEVNLATGIASDGQGGTDTLLHIEGIRGSSFSDTLTGGNPANGSGGTDGFEFYIGNAGDDTISGGAGYDRVDYTTSTAGVVVTLGGSGQGVALDGLGGVDTLIGIEAVRGSAFDDLLTGTDSAGFESFEGREGNDTMVGMGGSDRVDYGSAPAAVVVHLQTVLPVGVSNADSASDGDGASADTTTAIVLPIGKASDGYGGLDRLLGIEQVRGSAFNDLIVGDNGDNSLEGGAGNDTLLGGAGADTLNGGAGNDSLDGGANDPALGYDWVNYSTLGAAVTVNLATGTAICPDGTDTLARIEGVMGSAFADTLVGDGETNVLRGNLGNDTIDGGAGDDWADYSAASGSVTVSLAAGTSSGADGTDQLSNIERIRGSHFADQLTGDAGDNRLRGNRGDDTLNGGDGQDTADYYNATGSVVVNLVDGTASGADGNDTLISIEGALGSFAYGDLLQGDDGDNLLEGRGGDDSISGGAGNDTLNGGDGDDLLDGGTGIDVAVFDIAFQRGFYLRGAQPGELVIVGQGIDHLSSIEILEFANRRFALVRGGATADTLAGGTDDDLIDGGEGNDDINAGGGNDAVYGDEGNDSLTGGAGDGADTLDGGTGSDTMAGGDGDDEYAVDSVDDVVVETGGAQVLGAALWALAAGGIGGGIDKVVASINYTLGGFIENLELAGGAGLLIGAGNELDNDLLGNESDNTLSGAAGNDTLHGAGGNDAIDGGEGTDSAAFTGNRADYVLTKVAGGYTVADQTAARDGTDTVQNVETLVFADRNVDLTMGSRVAGVPAADLKTLEELYVGFFNRVPEAEGLGYWIGQLTSGVTLASIANQFYDAGVQFGVYSADMTDPQFIQAVYANVLYRPTPGDTAPNEQEIGYWNTRLLGGQDTKGTMVLTMLHDVHAYFETDPVYGFVAASLNNKAAVANYYAVQQGLSMNVQQDNVEFGIALAALITPTDTAAAIAYVGVSEFSML